MFYRPYVSGLDRRTEDDTLAQAPSVDLVAGGHHTEVVGAADTEAEDVLVHHIPHRRVHRRTKGTVVVRRWRLQITRVTELSAADVGLGPTLRRC